MQAVPDRVPALRILVADDDDFFAESIATVLAAEDRLDVVGRAADGQEAIELADSLRPDLVLMDLAMPRCDGIAATRQIKESTPETTVLVLTSSRIPEDIERASAAGATGYLTKEAVTSDLAATILEVAAVAVRRPGAARNHFGLSAR